MARKTAVIVYVSVSTSARALTRQCVERVECVAYKKRVCKCRQTYGWFTRAREKRRRIRFRPMRPVRTRHYDIHMLGQMVACARARRDMWDGDDVSFKNGHQLSAAAAKRSAATSRAIGAFRGACVCELAAGFMGMSIRFGTVGKSNECTNSCVTCVRVYSKSADRIPHLKKKQLLNCPL